MTSSESSAPKALIVDDMLLNRVVLTAALQRLGYAVTQASDGGGAIAELERIRFVVVFLDWALPDVGGDEILDHIGRIRPALPVIAITADDTPEMREHCRRRGVAGFLGKSFNHAELCAVLDEVVGWKKRSGVVAGPQASDVAAEDVLRTLRQRSQEHLASERHTLAGALAAGRTENALRALHNLASLAGMVGAQAISEAARKLEEQVRMGVPHEEALAAFDASLAAFRPVTREGGAARPKADA